MTRPGMLVLTAVHLVVAYCLIYYTLCCIKQSVNLKQGSLILLVLYTLAVLTCPLLVYKWQKMRMHMTVHHAASQVMHNLK